MEDFLLSLLVAIAETIADALMEFVLGAILDFLLRVVRKFFVATLQSEPAVAILLFGVAGLGAGCFSVFVLPHHLVQSSRFHGISLLVSPLLTGLALSEIGRWFQGRGQSSAAIESFGCGFAFAFGVALIRLALVR